MMCSAQHSLSFWLVAAKRLMGVYGSLMGYGRTGKDVTGKYTLSTLSIALRCCVAGGHVMYNEPRRCVTAAVRKVGVSCWSKSRSVAQIELPGAFLRNPIWCVF